MFVYHQELLDTSSSISHFGVVRFWKVEAQGGNYIYRPTKKKIFEPKVGRYIRTCYGFGFSAPDLAERPKHFKQVFFVLLYSCASD